MITSTQSFLELCTSLFPILKSIQRAGGCAYAVGGCVRDLVLGRAIKDLDIEVHGLSLDSLEQLLSRFGSVELVGKKFGVLLIRGILVDWAVPRRDSKGRKPSVEFDPTMDFIQAARRRDVTMNAMGINLHHIADCMKQLREKDNLKEFIALLDIQDPYGGLRDIAAGQMRAVDEKLFQEDPLRFFRVMQFVARFAMKPDAQLNRICSTMKLYDLFAEKPIAKERIWEEIKKMFMQSQQPSLGFRWVHSIGRLDEIFPELHALVGVLQRAEHHPEGDVFEHVMQSLDASAVQQDYMDTDLFSAEREKLLICSAILCHDMGKPSTTTIDFRARGHENAGVMVARRFMQRFCSDQKFIKMVCKLVKYHMRPLIFLKNGAKAKAYKRLAKKLAPDLSLRQLALLVRCDLRGRNEDRGTPLDYDDEKYQIFVDQAKSAGVLYAPEPPVLLGRHLIDEVGEGKQIGKLLDAAYTIQIEEGETNLDMLRNRVLKKRRN